jgi:hypothetical protein
MSYNPHQPPPQPTRPMSVPPISPGPYGQPYPAPPQPMYQQVVVAHTVPTSGWATASLVFGVLGMLGGFCLFGIPCIIAVISGHIGMNETKNGERGGRGLAVGGLILGYIFVAPAIAVIALGGIGAVLPAAPTP